MTSVKAFHFIGHLAFCQVDNKNSLWIACTADPATDKLHVGPLTTDTGAWGGGSWELSRSIQLGISLCQVRIPWLKPPILWNMQLFYDLYVESMSLRRLVSKASQTKARPFVSFRFEKYVHWVICCAASSCNKLGNLLLTWINLYPSMDK